jgi:hypothetical protein
MIVRLTPPRDSRYDYTGSPTFHWKNDPTGEVAHAMWELAKFILEKRQMSERGFHVLRLYLVYWAGAPIWFAQPIRDQRLADALPWLRVQIEQATDPMNLAILYGTLVRLGVDPC